MKAKELNKAARRALPRSRSVALITLSLLFSCAGKTSDGGSTLATCGSNCTTDQIAASCSSMCIKVVQSNCYPDGTLAQCTSNCTKVAAEASCSSKELALLRCVEPITPACSNGDLDFGSACNSLATDLEQCERAKAGVPGNSRVPDDPSVCPEIPRPIDQGACFSAGSAPVEGVDAGLGCTSSCQDSKGNLWEADCSGSTCSCSYNRERSCTCVVTGTGTCPSCCPGTVAQ